MTYPSELDIGHCIKMAHAAKEITQRKVSDDLGMKPQQYSQMIKHNGDLKVQVVMAVCNSMGMSLEELISYGNKHNSNQ